MKKISLFFYCFCFSLFFLLLQEFLKQNTEWRPNAIFHISSFLAFVGTVLIGTLVIFINEIVRYWINFRQKRQKK